MNTRTYLAVTLKTNNQKTVTVYLDPDIRLDLERQKRILIAYRNKDGFQSTSITGYYISSMTEKNSVIMLEIAKLDSLESRIVRFSGHQMPSITKTEIDALSIQKNQSVPKIDQYREIPSETKTSVPETKLTIDTESESAFSGASSPTISMPSSPTTSESSEPITPMSEASTPTRPSTPVPTQEEKSPFEKLFPNVPDPIDQFYQRQLAFLNEYEAQITTPQEREKFLENKKRLKEVIDGIKKEEDEKLTAKYLPIYQKGIETDSPNNPLSRYCEALLNKVLEQCNSPSVTLKERYLIQSGANLQGKIFSIEGNNIVFAISIAELSLQQRISLIQRFLNHKVFKFTSILIENLSGGFPFDYTNSKVKENLYNLMVSHYKKTKKDLLQKKVLEHRGKACEAFDLIFFYKNLKKFKEQIKQARLLKNKLLNLKDRSQQYNAELAKEISGWCDSADDKIREMDSYYSNLVKSDPFSLSQEEIQEEVIATAGLMSERLQSISSSYGKMNQKLMDVQTAAAKAKKEIQTQKPTLKINSSESQPRKEIEEKEKKEYQQFMAKIEDKKVELEESKNLQEKQKNEYKDLANLYVKIRSLLIGDNYERIHFWHDKRWLGGTTVVCYRPEDSREKHIRVPTAIGQNINLMLSNNDLGKINIDKIENFPARIKELRDILKQFVENIDQRLQGNPSRFFYRRTSTKDIYNILLDMKKITSQENLTWSKKEIEYIYIMARLRHFEQHHFPAPAKPKPNR